MWIFFTNVTYSAPITANKGFDSKSKKNTSSNKWKKNKEKDIWWKGVLEKPHQVMGKMNMEQKMLGKFQQVMDSINWTLEVQGRLHQVVGKAE